jgi:hypothetical protein
MMDIDGLINNRDQQHQQSLHLATNPFALPTSTSHPMPNPSSSSDHHHHHHTAAEMAAFAFPNISPTLGENDFGDPFHARKRSSHDVDDGMGGPRPSPPGRKKSQPKGGGAGGAGGGGLETGNRMSSAKDYPRRRALQACQICRARKTKCDNERPSCGSCDALGVECSYNEAPASKYSPDPSPRG